MVLAQKQTYHQWNRIEAQKHKQWRRESLFNKWCWENWTAPREKKKQKTFFNTIQKNKLEMD